MNKNYIDVIGYEEAYAESILKNKGITIREKKILAPPNHKNQNESGFQVRIVRQLINDETCEITIGYFLK
ncbi:MAG TPA: hypothetical protein GXZ31_08275 [Thermoanaerobacterales bacterium]|nr:hypothetical protein [Thermoanaerobacterales bacterium]